MSKADPRDSERLAFMERYLRGSLLILDRIGSDLGQIEALSRRAAAVIQGGASVYASMNFGHLPEYETAPVRRGNPGLIKEHGGWGGVDFARLRTGDMVFTNACTRQAREARERGVYVVAVTSSYINNEFRPPSITCPNEDGLLLRDVANEILHNQAHYEQGLCCAPEIPGVTLCPSSATGTCALFWMLNAGIVAAVDRQDGGAALACASYLSILHRRVTALEMHLEKIQKTAILMAERVLDRGAWHTRSLEYAGLASELHGVECGPMIINSTDWNSAKPNVLLINAISPSDPDELKLAAQKRDEGAYVVAIAPASLDGATPGCRLLDVADAGFDNVSPELGGVMRTQGRLDANCPTSGVVGNILQQMLCAQWTDEMIRKGAPPFFFKGINQVGGRAFNAERKPLFERRGY